MQVSDVSAEIVISTGLAIWGTVWGFHKIVISKDFERVDTKIDDKIELLKKSTGQDLDRIDNEIENLRTSINHNSESLSEIKGKITDTKISLAKIEENSRFMFDSVKEMKAEMKTDITNLYQKIEALLKK